jgi:hypothetical protein
MLKLTIKIVHLYTGSARKKTPANAEPEGLKAGKLESWKAGKLESWKAGKLER